jgi:L-asparagine transporter-like permease
MSFFRYLKNVIVFAALLSLVAGVLSFTLPKEYFVPQIWMILVYFLVISVVFQLILLQKQKGEPKKYIRTFLASTTIKLFIHMIALIVFALTNRDEAVPLIIAFFCCYLLFTIFEVTMQMKEPKENISPETQKKN